MRIIKEVTVMGRDNNYDINIDNILVKKVRIVRISKKYNNFHYIFLFNSEGEVISGVFNFLNDECKDDGVSGRDQAASALKILYTFSEIIGKEIQDFKKIDTKNLSMFMQGINITGNFESYIFKSNRSISTHDQYFDIIRKYLKYLEINNIDFFATVKTTVRTNNGNSNDAEKYVTNIGARGSYYTDVPAFISFDQYYKIIDLIEKGDSKFKLRNKLIINLMYMRGLRIGEVLGITIEDIKPHPNDSKCGILFIRNRVSDTGDQKAKTCMKVNSNADYKTDRYRSQKHDGFQTTSIPRLLMNQIKEYIEESRSILDKKVDDLDKAESLTFIRRIEADCVEEGTIKNYYLFLNKNLGPLHQGGWSKELKGLFLQAGLSIDRNTKISNLSHRFRHGFAMYLLEELKKDIYFIKREMRHASIQSTLIYLNPTPETTLQDAEQINKEMQEKLRGKLENEITSETELKSSEHIMESIEKKLGLS